jgi:hypothetical protein
MDMATPKKAEGAERIALATLLASIEIVRQLKR